MIRRNLFLLIAIAGVAEAAPVADEIARARVALEGGHFEDAEQIALGAIAADPNSTDALHVAGLAAFRAGEWARARDWFQRELDAGRAGGRDDERVTRFNLAGAELKLGRFADAERDYDLAATEDRIAPLASLNSGLAADAQGEWQRARTHFLRARTLGEARGQEEFAERAGELERRALGFGRDHAWRLAREGVTALKERRTEAAIATLEHAIAEARASDLPERDRADFEYSLGHALLVSGRTSAAISVLQRAISSSPTDGEYHYLLAVALHKSHDDPGAIREFHQALDNGLFGDDAAEAREFIASGRGATQARVTVENQVSVGYDTNYPGGRELLFSTGTAPPGQSLGSWALIANLEPRVRLLGRAGNGLFLGDRLNALLYFSSAADSFSLIENDLYLEGAWSPREWLTLSAAVEGYLQTTGLSTFGLYQIGGQAWLKATLFEGNHFATRIRYGFIAIDSQQSLYGYLSGTHHDAQLAQSLYLGTWRLSASYTLHADLVGVDTNTSSNLLSPTAESAIEAATHSPEAIYSIPFAYLGHDVGIDLSGDAGGFHIATSIHYERRDYRGPVVITPSPSSGFNKLRVDDRFTLELSLQHEIRWGLFARASVYALVSGSNIDNTNPLTPYDYDDRNYTRVLATFDLLRPF